MNTIRHKILIGMIVMLATVMMRPASAETTAAIESCVTSTMGTPAARCNFSMRCPRDARCTL
jgi:hypothetical protein